MTQPIRYLQTDPRWAKLDYSAKGEKTTIGASGCGPTAMAMVLATWADKSVTPKSECAWALSRGYKAPKQGTYYGYFTPAAKRYGLKAYMLNSTTIYGKKEAKEQERFISLNSVDLPDDAPTIEERMIRMENVEALAKVWDDLPEDMRYLLSGYYLLGYKTSQLARELGCGESTVRMRLTRARRYAKELMQQKEGVSP